MKRSTAIVLQLWLPVLIVALWWVLTIGSTSLFFPPLSEIVAHFGHWWLGEGFVRDFVPSLRNLALGYTLAVVLGIGGGLVIGSLPRLREAIAPELEYARAIPAVALLPAAVIILGLGDLMRVSLIAVGAVWPVLLATIAGVRETMARLGDVETSFRLPLHVRALVRVQGALPRILAGARTSIAIAVVLIVVSEMQGGAYGIGNRLLNSQRNYAISEMWSAMLLLGLLGYTVNSLFLLAERRLLRSYPESQNTRKVKS
ncbi:MAG: ABC transporter permease subunit [Pseudomonadota bacterium]|nr:ABC transporter permease subunit [Pseudomonadota bacterium]